MDNIRMIEIYVSLNGNDDWSGKFEETNIDKSDGPLKTIQKAFQIARLLSENEPGSFHTNIILREGVYFVEKTIEVDYSLSNPISISSYHGEKVTICGGRVIENWEKSKINGIDVWYCDTFAENDVCVNQLFVNDKRCIRSRLPKKGYYRIENVPNMDFDVDLTYRTNRFIFKEGDLKKFENLEDVELVILHYWIEERFTARDIDEENRFFHSDRISMFNLREAFNKKYARYYVENVKEALIEPGEWYFESRTRRIYYVPFDNEVIEEAKAYVPVVETLFDFKGDIYNGNKISFWSFKNIEFSHTAWKQPGNRKQKIEGEEIEFAGCPQAAIDYKGTISFSGSNNITIENCIFKHIGGTAIKIGEACSKIHIKENDMFDIGAGAIILNGSNGNELTNRQTHNNVIEDNEIYNIGVVHHSGVGINCMHSFNNKICHNHIHHTYYSAINSGWVWGYSDSVTCDNLISYNHLHDLGQGVLSDLGGVYTLGIQPGTVISNNLIHDVISADYGGWGVYMDEGSSYILIENNICYNIKSNVFNQHYGKENIIRNNIFAYGGDSIISLGKAQKHLSFSLINNIMIQTNNEPIYLGGYNGQLEKKSFFSDLNILIVNKEMIVVGRNRKNTDIDGSEGMVDFSLEDMRNYKYDLHSSIVSIGLIDNGKYDFESIARPYFKNIGFDKIEISKVGPRNK